VFEEFFLSKHNGKKLSWTMAVGHCLIHYQHELVHLKLIKGNKDLVLSLYQTVVLLLFNNHDIMTTSEIESSTLLENQDLERTLQSLSLGKIKLLKKKPHTKQVLPSDTWTLNKEFTHPLRRIIINQIQAQETPQEIIDTSERVFEDRQYQVDACIVRIMKQEKRLTFKKLIGQLFESLKFPIEVFDN
jgi:cullin 4